MREKNGGSIVVAVLLISILGAVLIFCGVRNKIMASSPVTLEQVFNGECGEGAYVRDSIDTSGGKYLELTKRLEFIPYKVENYYVIFNSDYTKCISYKGSNDWNKKFDQNTGKCDVVIEGKLEDLDYEVNSAYQEAITKLKEGGYACSGIRLNINSGIGIYSTMQILAGIALILLVIDGAIIMNKQSDNKILKLVGMVSIVLALISLVYIFAMR